MINEKLKCARKALMIWLPILCFMGFLWETDAQVVINEVSNRNNTQLFDEDGESKDWIELYNNSDETVNLAGWCLSDTNGIPDKWVFPKINLNAKEHLVLFASGKDRTINGLNSTWETAVLPSDVFQYKVPTTTIPYWNRVTFNTDNWETGSAGFGYGDDDDVTIIASKTPVVYIRKNFTIPDTSVITDAICHVDYDDGFVAYLNGVEICRANITGTPTYNSLAAGNREAELVNGEAPEEFILDMDVILSAIREGENTFAVEVHNVSLSSSDLSLIPYLSFKILGDNSFFSNAPSWLSNTETGYFHTNFKLKSKGEPIFLYNNQKILASFIRVPNLIVDHSIGRSTDGADDVAVFTTATPGKSNNTSKAYDGSYTPKPEFSLKAGFYNGSQSLSLSEQSGTYEVRYTKDGSTPSKTSTLFTGTPITISSTTTINARCFNASENQLPGNTSTATYFIDEDFTVPVLVVTTDRENLFGSSGIFTNNQEEWNKPCYIEYFDGDKSLEISQASGIQVDGGAGGSRTKPQTSFRIEPDNSTFGDGAVKYNFHPNRPNRKNYESLYLRNGSNQYLTLIYKDAAQVRGMGRNTHNFYSEFRPIVVYVNGEYYGLYEGREKINADYLESNYEIDADSMDMVGISHFKDPRTILPIQGSSEPFFEDYDRFLAMNPASPTFLEEVSTFLDIDNYTDYMAGQTWMTNKDWPHNNMKSWRCKGSGMRWQFAIVDLEWSFLPTRTNVNLATLPDYDQIEYMNGLGTQWPASGYWYRLMQNDEYKYHFINRLCDLMNTSYDGVALQAMENKIFGEVIYEMDRYYDRWNGGDIYDFHQNHASFSDQLGIREAYLRQHMRTHYNISNNVNITLDVEPAGAGKIKISTITPSSYPWKGDYMSDVPVSVKALARPGYRFKGWEANNNIGELSSNEFVSIISDVSTSFKAIFEEAESPFDGVTISEISYKDGVDINTTDWFEIWNATDANLSLDGWYFTDSDSSHVYNFLSTISISAGDRLVVAKDLARFAMLYPNITDFTGGFTFGLGRPHDEIKLYNAEKELVAHVKYSDLYPWHLSNDYSGRTLELMNPESSLLDVDNWFAGCVLGSPGEAYNPNCVNAANVIDEQFATKMDVKAYPNPAQNSVSLALTLSKAQRNMQVNIYNTMGALVYSKGFDGLFIGANTLDLDISNLPSGKMYFIGVRSNEFNKTIKLIKQ